MCDTKISKYIDYDLQHFRTVRSFQFDLLIYAQTTLMNLKRRTKLYIITVLIEQYKYMRMQLQRSLRIDQYGYCGSMNVIIPVYLLMISGIQGKNEDCIDR